jgi:Mn-dependent DtxR family transcriptional regulator
LTPPLPHRVILIMAAKYAQRRSAADLALQMRIDERLVSDELCCLERLGYARCWPDGTWGLTQQGNAKRNQLTS